MFTDVYVMRKVVCLPQIICSHLFGENHSLHHRAICGGCISCTAFIIMYLFAGTHIQVIGDAIGTSLHAIGFHPIIESIQYKPTTKNEIKNENSNS